MEAWVNSLSWTNLAPLVIGFLGGFVIALFAEPVRNWVYRPRLSLKFERSDEFSVWVHDSTRYFRVRVTNRKGQIAKACRAYLLSIECLDATLESDHQQFRRIEPYTSVPLPWVGRGSAAYAPIDLPRGIPHHFDVVQAERDSTEFKIATKQLPPGTYLDLELQTLYRITVAIAGDQFPPVQMRLVLAWRGHCSDADAWVDDADAWVEPSSFESMRRRWRWAKRRLTTRWSRRRRH